MLTRSITLILGLGGSILRPFHPSRFRAFLISATALVASLPPQPAMASDPGCAPSGGRVPSGPEFAIEGLCISPDGNGIADVLVIDGGSSEDSDPRAIKATISNGSGDVVRQIEADGPNPTVIWDGTNTFAQRVADGDYVLELYVPCDQQLTQKQPLILGIEISDIALSCGTGTTLPWGDIVNDLLPPIPVRVDTTAPTIEDLAVSEPAFSPNADGVKDTTTLSAHLRDASPTLSWQVQVLSSEGAVRTFSGTGSDVSATWDGTDDAGDTVPEGTYRMALLARDAVGNPRTEVATVIDDLTPPQIVSATPAEVANTLLRRPTFTATIADGLAGIDGGASRIRLDATVLATFGASTTGATDPRHAIAPAPADLPQDQDRPWEITALDMAGNENTSHRGIRFVNVHQEPFAASIPARTAVVPDCADPIAVATGCNVTFREVATVTGGHEIAISSSSHEGSGAFRRAIPITAASVEWTMSSGSLSTTHDLGAVSTEYTLSLDDSWDRPFSVPVSAESVAMGDITIPVPAGATAGSTATLLMPTVSIPAACSETAVASDPTQCGGPANASAEPLTDGYQSEYPDPTLDGPIRPIEQIFAEQEALAVDDGLPAQLADMTGLEANQLPPSGDISASSFGIGVIEIKTASGVDALTVLADHGGVPADLAQSLEGPFSPEESEVGLDRWYRIAVAPGSEKAKVTEYASDARVEYAQLDAADGGTIAAYGDPKTPNDPGVSSSPAPSDQPANPKGRQWNLGVGSDARRKPHGIHPLGAWGITDGKSFAGRKVETAYIDTRFRTSHEDFAGKITTSPSAFPGSDASSYADCNADLRRHGTWIAGINATTNNGKGVAGVNWGGYMVPVTAGVSPTWNDIAKRTDCPFRENQRAEWIRRAANFQTDDGGRIEVINQSLMFKAEAVDKKDCEAIQAAYSQGIVTVTAAPYGETSSDATHNAKWPTACPYALGVTASTENGLVLQKARAWTSISDVAAPGTEIYTADSGNDSDYTKVPHQGTSVAAPHVAGLVHLLQQMGAPAYSAFRTPGWSATPIQDCDAGASAPSCRGRINVTRAVKGTLHNGVFAQWSANGARPESWARGGSCATESDLWKGADVSLGGGGYAAAMKCRGSGAIYMLTRAAVSEGFKYRLTVRARRGGGNADAASAVVTVCFFESDPWLTDDRAKSCHSKTSDGAVLSDGGYRTWVFDPDYEVPSGVRFATVTLRAKQTGSGWIAWDDAGLSAIPA